LAAVVPADVVANELEKVDPRVPQLFEREDTFYSTIEKRSVEKVSSRAMRIPLAIRPGGKFGHFDAAGGDLGRGGGPTWDKATIQTVDLKYADLEQAIQI